MRSKKKHILRDSNSNSRMAKQFDRSAPPAPYAIRSQFFTGSLNGLHLYAVWLVLEVCKNNRNIDSFKVGPWKS